MKGKGIIAMILLFIICMSSDAQLLPRFLCAKPTTPKFARPTLVRPLQNLSELSIKSLLRESLRQDHLVSTRQSHVSPKPQVATTQISFLGRKNPQLQRLQDLVSQSGSERLMKIVGLEKISPISVVDVNNYLERRRKELEMKLMNIHFDFLIEDDLETHNIYHFYEFEYAA